MARTVKNVLVRITVATAGDAQPISAIPLFVSDFEFQPDVANTGTNMYIGDVDVDNTYISRTKGSITNVTSGNGHAYNDPMIDLSKWYVDGDSDGDVGIIQYKVLTED